MRSDRLVYTLLACLMVVAAQARAQFEGILESRNLTTSEIGELEEYVMTIAVKHDMVRIETTPTESMEGALMIYRNDKGVVWIVNEEERTYFEIVQQEPEQVSPPGGPTLSNSFTVKKTGKKMKILGYPCEQITISREGEETEIWATKELGKVFRAISQGLGEESADHGETWADELRKLGLYPLKSVTKIEGHVVESQEVTRIEQKQLPDSLFAIPEGFVKQDTRKFFERFENEW